MFSNRIFQFFINGDGIFLDPRQSVTVETIPTPKVIEDVNRAVDVKPHNPTDTDVLIMNRDNEDRPTSFFAQPGILAGNIWEKKLKRGDINVFLFQR